MHPVISMICWLVLGTWLLPAFAHPDEQATGQLGCNQGGTRRQGGR